VPSTRVRRRREFEVSGTECTGQGNDFKLTPTVKKETRHPVENQSGSYRGIQNYPRTIIY